MIEKKLRRIQREIFEQLERFPDSQYAHIDREDAEFIIFLFGQVADSLNDIAMYIGMHPDSDEQPCPPPPKGEGE